MKVAFSLGKPFPWEKAVHGGKMGGLLKKLFGFGNPLQKVVQTAPTSASSQGEKQEGFFTQKQQQLLVAQLQKAISRTGLKEANRLTKENEKVLRKVA